MKVTKFDLSSLPSNVEVAARPNYIELKKEEDKEFIWADPCLQAENFLNGHNVPFLIKIPFPFHDVIKERFEKLFIESFDKEIDFRIRNQLGYNVTIDDIDFQDFIAPLYDAVLRRKFTSVKTCTKELVEETDFNWFAKKYTIYIQTNKQNNNVWHSHLSDINHIISLCTVFYLNIPEKGGEIEFITDNNEVLKVKPEKDMLYCFPPWLAHRPVKVESNETRICLNTDFCIPNRVYVKPDKNSPLPTVW